MISCALDSTEQIAAVETFNGSVYSPQGEERGRLGVAVSQEWSGEFQFCFNVEVHDLPLGLLA